MREVAESCSPEHSQGGHGDVEATAREWTDAIDKEATRGSFSPPRRARATSIGAPKTPGLNRTPRVRGSTRSSRRVRRESRRRAGAASLPGTDPSGASPGGGRVFFREDAGREGRARGRARSSPQRRVSLDRAGLAAPREGGCPRGRCRSRTDASGNLGAERGRPRCGERAPEGVLRVASGWRRRPQRLSRRGAQLSRLPN